MHRKTLRNRENKHSAIIVFLSLLLTGFIPVSSAAQPGYEAIFYQVDTEESFQSFKQNIEQISIVAPQTYRAGEDGVVWGEVDPRILSLADRHNVKVMPLIVNPGFDQKMFHRFLQDTAAQNRTIDMMVKLAQTHHFYGWQFDFENIHVTDRKAYTEFYRKAAKALHKRDFILSIAVVPTNTDFEFPTAYHRYMYQYWRGSFDLKELAEIGDFISLMTYAQHTRNTPPGPASGVPWMKEMVEYALDSGVPAEKISLGIPFYSTYWHADYTEERGGFINGSGASYKKVKGLVDRYDAEVVWLEKQQCHYALWDHNGVFEYAFIEDARSFASKLDVLKEYKLRGISVWRLGQEAPDVWEELRSQITAIHPK